MGMNEEAVGFFIPVRTLFRLEVLHNALYAYPSTHSE